MRIFCIRRNEGILPLVDFKSIFEGGDLAVPSSRYVLSSSISRDEEKAVSEEVISGLVKRVDYYIQDKHYLWRLFASAGVFLLLYLFMSLAIRDPLPMLDELLIATVGAIICWILIAKHDVNARFAVATKREWQESVLNADFEYSSEMGFVDEYMQKLEGYSYKEIVKMIASSSIPSYSDEKPSGLMEDLDSYLFYTKKLESKYIKQLSKGGYDERKMEKHLLQDYTLGNLDVYLLAFIIGFGRKSE